MQYVSFDLLFSRHSLINCWYLEVALAQQSRFIVAYVATWHIVTAAKFVKPTEHRRENFPLIIRPRYFRFISIQFLIKVNE